MRLVSVGTVLYDIFVDERWLGSRRTIAQCVAEVRSAGYDLGDAGWAAVACLSDGDKTHYELFATDGPPRQ